MSDTQNRALRFAFFVLGVAIPMVGLALWSKSSSWCSDSQARRDKELDETVQESFPASDPPASW